MMKAVSKLLSKKVRVIGLVICCFIYVLDVNGQEVLRVGQKAPDLKLAFLDGKPVAKPIAIDQFKGKVVVLDFWGTWCGPCIKALPHMKAIVDSLQGQPFEFINISDEPKRKVDEGIKRRNLVLAGKNGIDSMSQTTKSYFARPIPAIYLINSEGIIAAYLDNPYALTTRVLKGVLEGKPVSSKTIKRRGNANWDEELIAEAREQRKEIQFVLEPVNSISVPDKIIGETDRISCEGVFLSDLVNYLTDVPSWNFQWGLPEDRKMYRLSFYVHGQSLSIAKKILLDILRHKYSFSVSNMTEIKDVYVLKRTGSADPANFGSTTEERKPGTWMMDEFNLNSVDFETLATVLMASSGFGGKPVVNETGIKGSVYINIKWEHGNEQSWREALKKCGLSYKLERRQINIVSIVPL